MLEKRTLHFEITAASPSRTVTLTQDVIADTTSLPFSMKVKSGSDTIEVKMNAPEFQELDDAMQRIKQFRADMGLTPGAKARTGAVVEGTNRQQTHLEI